MATGTTNPKHFQRIVKAVRADWSPTAFARLGANLQRALIADAAMAELAAQDEGLSPESFRRMFDDLYVKVMEFNNDEVPR